MLKNMNLTAKLMLSIGIVVMFSFVATVSFITLKATGLSRQQALDTINAEAGAYAGQMRLEIEKAMDTARSLAYATQEMKVKKALVNRQTLLTMMGGMLKENPGFLGIWTVWEPNAFDGLDKDFQGATGHTDKGRFVPYWNRVGGVHLEACVDLTGEWYTRARDTRKEVVMDPFSYEVGGKTVMLISVCVPIIVNGQSIGVAGVDFSMDQIAELVSSIKPYETGYAILATGSGMIAAHPDSEKVGKYLKDQYPDSIVRAAKEQKSAHVATTLETTGEDSIFTMTPMAIGKTETPWYIGINAPADKMLEQVFAMRNISVLISALSLVIVGVLVFFLARTVIVKPVENVIKSLRDISEGEGDLTQRLAVSSRDELGRLAEVFNGFISKLQTMIKEISQGVETLSASSTELSAISEQLSRGSSETSEKSSTVAAATEEMAASMNAITAAMEESSSNANTVATAAEQMNATINEIARNAETARGISGQAVSKVDESTGKMNELGQAAQAIGQVVETITDISEQVNLLSLNATIEAARAGEAGKGFAVVANEIKDLARQTSEASMDIKKRIEHIQESASGTQEGIREISGVINNVNDIVSTIATAVEEQSSATREISENINHVSTSIQDVNDNVNQSTTVTDEISKDISEVNGSSGEIAERSGQVRLSADELSKLAEELNQMVGRFKV